MGESDQNGDSDQNPDLLCEGGGGVEEDDKLYEIPKFLSKGEEPSMVRIYQPTLVMIHSLPNISYSII